MNFSVSIAPQASSMFENPILIAAIITFSGVLLTVFVGTLGNFRLAKRRNEFEERLARQRFTYERELAASKLEDEKAARRESRRSASRLRQIDFERTTLLQAQESIHAFMKHLVSLYDEKKEFHEDHGTLDDFAPSGPLKENIRKSFETTSLLESRISNDALRASFTAVRSHGSAVNRNADDFSDLRKPYSDLIISGAALLAEIGKCVRLLDRDELDEIDNTQPLTPTPIPLDE